jgi:alpha-tubulin suppressor-like RCC1 family protein
VWCWGYNERGNLGVGTLTRAELPVQVGRGYSGVSAGGDHACAVRIDGELECWGYNDSLELGVPGASAIPSPVRPGCEPANAGDRCFSDWTAVGVGAFHSCAVRASGELYCWGGNLNGQLGIGPMGSTKDQAEPQRVAGNVRWASVAGGDRHTCALDLNGALYCWGMNEDRQLGIPNADFVSLPTRIDADAPDGWRALGLGERHSCAVRADRTLWCWGLNSSGQAGIGTVTETPAPRPRRVCF